MTQIDQILNHLKSGKPITPIDALNKFGCFRLGARIFDLKREGHNIHKQMIETPKGARVAEYRLI
jgi:hypothetical protein